MDEKDYVRYIGIDLGTTNTSISVVNIRERGEQRPEVLKDRNENYFPSFIYFDKGDRKHCGHRAKENAQKWQNAKIDEVIPYVHSFKKKMGTNYIFEIGKSEYTAVDLSSTILERCGNLYNKEYNNTYRNNNGMGYENIPTVITHPAGFSSKQKEDTKKAAEKARFKNVKLLDEPTAAILSFLYNEISKHKDARKVDLSEMKKFMVIDFGGGTFDIVILHAMYIDEQKRLEIKPIGNPTRIDIGGVDLDNELKHHLFEEFVNQNKLSNEDIKISDRKRIEARLLVVSEIIKEKLSSYLNDTLDEEDISHKDYTMASKEEAKDIHKNVETYNILESGLKINDISYNLDYTIDLNKYLNIVEKLLYTRNEQIITTDESKGNIEDVILKTLSGCNITKDDVDYVFFTGGMSKFTPARRVIYEIVGKEIIYPEDPMTAVANGAALYSIFEENKHKNTYESFINIELKASKTIEKAYMIKRYDNLPEIMIDKNQEYPYKYTIYREYKTTSANGVLINIYRGEGKYDPMLELFDQYVFEFKDTDIIEIGTPININYLIDNNGILLLNIEINNVIYQKNKGTGIMEKKENYISDEQYQNGIKYVFKTKYSEKNFEKYEEIYEILKSNSRENNRERLKNELKRMNDSIIMDNKCPIEIMLYCSLTVNSILENDEKSRIILVDLISEILKTSKLDKKYIWDVILHIMRDWNRENQIKMILEAIGKDGENIDLMKNIIEVLKNNNFKAYYKEVLEMIVNSGKKELANEFMIIVSKYSSIENAELNNLLSSKKFYDNKEKIKSILSEINVKDYEMNTEKTTFKELSKYIPGNRTGKDKIITRDILIKLNSSFEDERKKAWNELYKYLKREKSVHQLLNDVSYHSKNDHLEYKMEFGKYLSKFIIEKTEDINDEFGVSDNVIHACIDVHKYLNKKDFDILTKTMETTRNVNNLINILNYSKYKDEKCREKIICNCLLISNLRDNNVNLKAIERFNYFDQTMIRGMIDYLCESLETNDRVDNVLGNFNKVVQRTNKMKKDLTNNDFSNRIGKKINKYITNTTVKESTIEHIIKLVEYLDSNNDYRNKIINYIKRNHPQYKKEISKLTKNGPIKELS